MASDGGSAPRHRFMDACGLPTAWADQPQWRILETCFASGLNFLTAWSAWNDDARRPRILHYVAIAETPCSIDAIVSCAESWPQLQPLIRLLTPEWYGVLPGVHRMVFEQGRVLLTLCIGDTAKMLRQLDFHADSVFLNHPAVQVGAQAVDPAALKTLARRCRRGTGIAAFAGGGVVGAALQRHGFAMQERNPSPPPFELVCGRFAPVWEPRTAQAREPAVPGDCIVVGAGLAGAAVAASLARRGWQVLVLDAGAAPASGASGLPAGVLVPHGSPDDNLLSRLSRDGVRATLQQAHALLQLGLDWEPSGVLEHHIDGALAPRQPAGGAAAVWSRPATSEQIRLAGLDASAAADWHEKAAWIRPAALIDAWLAAPGVTLQSGVRVAALVRQGAGWHALDASGRLLAQAGLVIVAAALASQELIEGLTLQAVRGQITWALHDSPLQLPPFPVNGDGSFIPSLPTTQGPVWLCGASFDRSDTVLSPRAADQQGNFDRLKRLLPAVAGQLAPVFSSGKAQAWTGIRCASTDRRPLVGPVDEQNPKGLWLNTAMGSRGLTFAALCGELIAARVHGEPLPLARNLARALYPARQKNRPPARAEADA